MADADWLICGSPSVSAILSTVQHSARSLACLLFAAMLAVDALCGFYEDVASHLPSPNLLLLVLPLFLQALLLRPRQTDALKFARLALMPVGVYYAYKTLDYKFQPAHAFRAHNFILALIFPVGAGKAIELGLVQESYRWIGIQNAVNGQSRSDDSKSQRGFDLDAPLFSLESLKFAGILMLT